jgi:hypothetical protein
MKFLKSGPGTAEKSSCTLHKGFPHAHLEPRQASPKSPDVQFATLPWSQSSEYDGVKYKDRKKRAKQFAF